MIFSVLNPPNPPHLKMSLHYLVKCTTFSSDWRYVAFLQTLMALIKAGCGLALAALKRTGCDVWQMKCQASNVTAHAQNDHLLHASSLFCHWSTALSTMLCWNSAHVPTRRPQLVRITDWYSIHTHKNKKMKNVCSLQGSAVTFFRCGG